MIIDERMDGVNALKVSKACTRLRASVPTTTVVCDPESTTSPPEMAQVIHGMSTRSRTVVVVVAAILRERGWIEGRAGMARNADECIGL